MTEAEWLAGTDPEPMLEFLCGKASERKLRLFACGCCRRIWHLLTDEESRAAVEVVERFADGLVTKRHLSAARSRANRATFQRGAGHIVFQVAFEKLSSVVGSIARRTIYCAAAHPGSSEVKQGSFAARLLRDFLDNPFSRTRINPSSSDVEQESVAVALFLRDIFGNPFRPIVFDPTWRTSTVLALASGIYQEKAFDRMPILADALQDAECANEDILNHCRGPGPHCRGCWLLDLVTGRS